MDEAKYLMKNYGDRGGRYPSRPWAEADNTLLDLHKYLLLAEFSVRTVNYGPSFFPSISGEP